MKSLSLIFALFIVHYSFGQKINHIEYKQDCNRIYQLGVDSSQYHTALIKLRNLENKYGTLYTEEHILRAFCFHKLNNNRKASISMREAWSNRVCDPAYLYQMEGFAWEKMLESFNKKEMKRVEQGYENNLKLRSKDYDSLAFLIKQLTTRDQTFRSFLSQEEMDSLASELSLNSVNQDSLDILEFGRIYAKYGFPGEKVSCFFSQRFVVFMLHTADYDWFVEKMRPKFLEDVKNGDMPASLFLIWLDRNSAASGKKEEFAMYVNPENFNATPEEIEEIKKARLSYGIVNSFRVPYQFLSL